MKPRKKQPVTTEGAGYIPQLVNVYDLILSVASGWLPKDSIRRRLYRNIKPVGYDNSIKRVINAIKYNKPEYMPFDVQKDDIRDDIWAEYLKIPQNERSSIYKLKKSQYKPTKNGSDLEYYSLPLSNFEWDCVINDAMNTTKMPAAYKDSGKPNYTILETLPPLYRNLNKLSDSLSQYLATHTVGRGSDNKRGDYVSYYDKWDLSPVGGYGEDLSGSIGNPVPIYDRMYLDDYYGVDSSARPGTYYGGYLPEVMIKPRKNDTK